MYCTNDGKVEDDISKTVRELIRNNDLEILHSTLTDISNFEREKLISAGTVGKDFTSDHYKHSTSALKKPCPRANIRSVSVLRLRALFSVLSMIFAK